MANYVYCTLSNDQEYTVYQPGRDPRAVPVAIFSCMINGMANVLNRKTMTTPKGAVTEVTDEQLKQLEEVPMFQEHIEAGFIQVSKSKTDPAKVAANMTPKDNSAQTTDEDFEEDSKPKVNVG